MLNLVFFTMVSLACSCLEPIGYKVKDSKVYFGANPVTGADSKSFSVLPFPVKEKKILDVLVKVPSSAFDEMNCQCPEMPSWYGQDAKNVFFKENLLQGVKPGIRYLGRSRDLVTDGAKVFWQGIELEKFNSLFGQKEYFDFFSHYVACGSTARLKDDKSVCDEKTKTWRKK